METKPLGRLDCFTSWYAQELLTPAMTEAAALLERACDLHLENLFRAHIAEHLAHARTVDELNQVLGFEESASIALEAILLRLSDRTNLVRRNEGNGAWTYEARQQGRNTSTELNEIRQRFQSLGDGYAAAMDFIDFGAQHFVMALRDDPEFMDRVLTGREAHYRDLWDRATNEDPLQDAHGRMGASVIAQVFESGEILEIGSGTGNGTRHLLQHFSLLGRLDSLTTYVFTDISLSFILTTRRKLLQAYPSVKMEWRTLDINLPFEEQKFPRESVDLIYGVNAAHVARDIVGLLRECLSTLRQGGKVVFAERVRLKGTEMAPRELALNLSIYHRTAAHRNSDYRPMHGYLTPSGWLRALDLAGFHQARIVPDIEVLSDRFPNQYAAVVVAEK